MKKLLIVDFGSQYTQLIANVIRKLKVFCEVIPYNRLSIAITFDSSICGIILSGGPGSVTEITHPNISFSDILDKNLPVLGICYGAQLIAKTFGGKVEKTNGEYGNTQIKIEYTGNIVNNEKIYLQDKILEGIDEMYVWMSHNDTITELPNNWEVFSKTENGKIAMFGNNEIKHYGMQFHPEVSHTKYGSKLLNNFTKICDCDIKWTEESFIERCIKDIQIKVGDDSVIMALSGGVDSTVAAHLIHRAIGRNLHCVVVNNGYMRKGEYEEVMKYCENFGMNVEGVDASDIFYRNMYGITDPEAKRKIIGRVFIEIFSNIAIKNNRIKFLGQGTIYPDVIESVSGKGKIKSHHNVGGLPKDMDLELLEPLRILFKDEVRRVGEKLNIPSSIILRHPFPGPGLSIRILGEATKENAITLQNADKIYIDKLIEYGLYNKIWQAGAIFLPIKSVGVMGDVRTYENVIALRAVESINGMTADWYDFRKDFLSDVSNTIINTVKGVNRVVYDISSKPPATIEWE